MHYLIDGYNFFFFVKDETMPLEEHRNQFIDYLSTTLSHLNASLYFDSNFEQAEAFPRKHVVGKLEIVYAPQGITADQAIIEHLKWCENPKICKVVTNDKHLTRECKDTGAKTMTISEFLTLIRPRTKTVERKPNQDSQREIERLTKAFEERLKNPPKGKRFIDEP
ncbi:MAG: hypothetical protein SP1CHLAM54_14990 [Chlamydiia bacterium]|nr:hypothetical protein [Chlamydiia bacterium]MCH9616389.1 hypothetical protein [Chlamydiia bacterium]MCH9629625.1 hypothetical protein [Chlamydiia bacterium]